MVSVGPCTGQPDPLCPWLACLASPAGAYPHTLAGLDEQGLEHTPIPKRSATLSYLPTTKPESDVSIETRLCECVAAVTVT